MRYEEYIKGKSLKTPDVGITLARCDLNEKLFDFQKDLVLWALRKGRAALFCDTGLGKTLMQLEWAAKVQKHTGAKCLILAPLAVGLQTQGIADFMGIKAKYCATAQELESFDGICIINYDRLTEVDPSLFSGVVLDESSILKNYTGKTKQLLCDMFSEKKYKLCATATPAPNDHLELGNHSQFLGWMNSNEMISRWFINDTMSAGDYRLKKHAEDDYWKWVCSWAACVTKPSDIGYSDDGYDLPPLEIEEIICHTEYKPDDALFAFGRPSASELYRISRGSLNPRIEQVKSRIEDEPDELFVVWCQTNEESALVVESVAGAVEIVGSMTPSQKELILKRFEAGEIKVLVTKASLTGLGLNWQLCARTIFLGVNYSYEGFYQAVRRFYRFGQERAVKAWVITSEGEAGVLETLRRKQADHERMKTAMAAATKQYTLENLKMEDKELEIHSVVDEGDWTAVHSDCVIGMREMEENSVGMMVFSPPFSNLYIYSDDPADMGNTAGDDDFFEQFGYAIEEMHRILKPGRIVAVHCKDLPMYKGRDGAMGMRDFSGQIIQAFEAKGFIFHSRVTIWKDPVIEMQRTKNHGLLYKELCKDSCGSRQGMADYMVMFRKWEGEFEDPVHRDGERFRDHEYIGTDEPVFQNIEGFERYRSIQVWQKYASPVWFDINQTRVLNYQLGKDNKDEKHICPLQLDVIERCIELWSNPGDLIVSPFMGIGSEGYCALAAGRKFKGFELKESYFSQAIKNMRKAVSEANAQGALFEAGAAV